MSHSSTDAHNTAPRRPSRAAVATGLMWALVLALVPILLQHRYAGIPHRSTVGWDYNIFIHAAGRILHGQSPYTVPGYTYTPLLAILMAPLAHLSIIHAWKAWIFIELAAVVVGVGVFVVTEARGRPAWQAPLLYAFGFVTAMNFWPLERLMRLGQVDFFVVVLILISVWGQSRGKPAVRGIFLGLAALLKVWPIFNAVVLLQRGLVDRTRAIVAVVCTLLTAPIILFAFGGMSAARAFVSNTSSQRSYHLVSHSLWGTASLLFSKTGLARPLYVSNGVRIGLICILLPWVIGLMLLALRTPGDATLCTWNIAGCLVLVIPVSHLAYSVFLLPILWVWGARLLNREYASWEAHAVFVVLVVWWLLQTHSWPDDLFSHHISAVRYSIVFAVNLIACTASVLGNWMIQRRGSMPGVTPADELAAPA